MEVDLSKIPKNFKVSAIILQYRADPPISGTVYVLPVVGRPTDALNGTWAGDMFNSLGFDEATDCFAILDEDISLSDTAVSELQNAISSGQGWWAIGLRWQNEISDDDEAVTLSKVVLILLGE